jgi:hypothetical protein
MRSSAQILEQKEKHMNLVTNTQVAVNGVVHENVFTSVPQGELA